MRKSILDELRGELLSRASLDCLEEPIWKGIGSLNTWGSNAIEGNTLTLDEVQAVLIKQVGVAKPVSDILETKQHEEAFRDLIKRRNRAIDLAVVQEIHEEVFRGLMPDAGQWRRMNVKIEGSKFSPPRPEKIVKMMDEWMKEYDQRDLRGEDVFSLGAWMHHRFESIHPFGNGNGRVGRLLLNLHFLKHNWPSVQILPFDRERYIESLHMGNEGDLSALQNFLMVAMGGSILHLLSYVGTAQDELKPLADFNETGQYSAKYLRLRAGQGELPAFRVKRDWLTSERALSLYVSEVGRKTS